MNARHPYRLTGARQLREANESRHVADMVRLVLLSGFRSRLHRPDFGAGLGTTALFEPLDETLRGLTRLRATGSLESALGDRIEVLGVAVDIPTEATLRATVTYRIRPSGQPITTEAIVRVQ